MEEEIEEEKQERRESAVKSVGRMSFKWRLNLQNLSKINVFQKSTLMFILPSVSYRGPIRKQTKLLFNVVRIIQYTRDPRSLK